MSLRSIEGAPREEENQKKGENSRNVEYSLPCNLMRGWRMNPNTTFRRQIKTLRGGETWKKCKRKPLLNHSMIAILEIIFALKSKDRRWSRFAQMWGKWARYFIQICPRHKSIRPPSSNNSLSLSLSLCRPMRYDMHNSKWRMKEHQVVSTPSSLSNQRSSTLEGFRNQV